MERDRVAALLELERENTALRVEVEQLRLTVAVLRASVPPVHPADYGHEVWSTVLRDAVREEREAMVAWLQDPIDLWDIADKVERGEHRREGGGMTMSVDTKAIRARAEAATVGPWRVQTPACEHDDDEHSAIKGGGALVTDCVANENDAAFIAHARADIPALCDEVEALRGEVSLERWAERAAVVAWLRSRGMADYAQSNLDFAATMIERGEHRREEEE